MKNLDTNKAFQNILKKAPEMPQPNMPEDDPQSNGNGNIGLVISFALLIISQILIFKAINNSQKTILGQIKSFPQPPTIADGTNSQIEKENPPSDINS